LPYFRVPGGARPADYIGDNRIANVTPGSIVNYRVWDFEGKLITRGSTQSRAGGRMAAVRRAIAVVKRHGANERISLRSMRRDFGFRIVKLQFMIQTAVVVRADGDERNHIEYERDQIERDIHDQFVMQMEANRIPVGYIGGTALIEFPMSVWTTDPVANPS
jgi:hypothetical protein